MNVVVRKAAALARVLGEPSKVAPLIRSNFAQLRGWWRGDRPWVYPFFEDVPFVCQPANQTSLRLFLKGYAEQTEMSVASRWVRAGDWCIDVGANVGVYTSLLAHRVGSSGRVFALEPSPRSFAALQLCVETLGLEQVITLAACASSQAGIVPFHTARGTEAGAEEESIRVPAEDAHRFQRRLAPAVTIDGMLAAAESHRPVSFLKVDVEGAEPLVLEGARSVLESADLPLVFVEIHVPSLAGYHFSPDDVLRFLPEDRFARFFIPRSTSDSRTNRQPGHVYPVRPETEWPILSNVIAVPRLGIYAQRTDSIEPIMQGSTFHSS